MNELDLLNEEEFDKVLNENKQIQESVGGFWIDVKLPVWDNVCKFRVKPEHSLVKWSNE